MNNFYSMGVLGACLCLFGCGKDEGPAQVVGESSPQAVEIIGEEVTYEADGK
jgi:hypothetical protein